MRVVLVVVALVRVVCVGVVLVIIALVRVVHVPGTAVVLVLVALVGIVRVRVVLMVIALVGVVGLVRVVVRLMVVGVVLVVVALVGVVYMPRLVVMLVVVALVGVVRGLCHQLAGSANGITCRFGDARIHVGPFRPRGVMIVPLLVRRRSKHGHVPDADRMTTIADSTALPDGRGYFGEFGGRYVPETLMPALGELEAAYEAARADEAFAEELTGLLRTYVGRPTPITRARRLEERLAGDLAPRIYLKREDLAHTGAHKINAALAQGLLARRMGKQRIVAETGAGQHGVATATTCALLGLECVVYMGAEDVRRQALNVFRMKLLGAEVRTVETGSRTLKDAINEAIRDWVTNVRTTHYLLGSVVGPHPYPMVVRDFQSVIGVEARAQLLETEGRLPTVALACVGGGSNAMGMFHPLIDDDVRLIGVEAAGEGLDARHAATLTGGRPGVLHGARSYLLQDEHGQVVEAHSISAGLDYPGVGPEHAWLKVSERAEYVSVTDTEALEAFRLLSVTEGIIPALETSHAIAHLAKLAPELAADDIVLVSLSGRGDKDMGTVADALGVTL